MHVCFLYFLPPHFLTDSLVNTLIFEVVDLNVFFGILDGRVRDDCWHLWVRDGFWCICHDGSLTTIPVGCPKAALQLLHYPEKLFQGSRTKVENVTVQFTVMNLEVCLGFVIWTLGFGPNIFTYVLLGLGCLPLVFVSRAF